MKHPAFDTLKAYEKLMKSGMKDEQTRALLETVADIFKESQDDWTTKNDLFGVEGELQGYIAEVKAELKGDIANVKAELKGDIAEVKAELKGDIADVKAELKGDIAEVKAELKGDIADVKAELKGDIADVKAELKLLKWMVAVIVGCVVTLILKAFF
jgi:glycine cleavage system H lipoate-binding protein